MQFITIESLSQLKNLEQTSKCIKFGNKFNEKVIIPQNAKQIIFGETFNKKIKIPHHTTHLTFEYIEYVQGNNNFANTYGIEDSCMTNYMKIILYKILKKVEQHDFNQKIKIPQNITHLTFGIKFTRKIKIPQNITHLTLGYYFYQKIKIPQNITHLTLGCYFKQKIKIPQNITHLNIKNNFYSKKIIFNQNIIYLQICYSYCNNLIIPHNITHITFKHQQHIPMFFDYEKTVSEHSRNIKTIIPANVTQISTSQHVTIKNMRFVSKINAIKFTTVE